MLPFSEVNLFACLGATIACMLLGMLWYGPLFGKPWMKLVGLTKKDADKDMAKTMAMGLANSFLTAYGIGLLLLILTPADTHQAIMYILVPWFAFSAMGIFSDSIWAKASWKLSWINTGYTLFLTLITTTILMNWPW